MVCTSKINLPWRKSQGTLVDVISVVGSKGEAKTVLWIQGSSLQWKSECYKTALFYIRIYQFLSKSGTQRQKTGYIRIATSLQKKYMQCTNYTCNKIKQHSKTHILIPSYTDWYGLSVTVHLPLFCNKFLQVWLWL